MPIWLRIPCIVLGLVLIFAAFMVLAVMFNGTERPDLYVVAAGALGMLGALMAAIGIAARTR